MTNPTSSATSSRLLASSAPASHPSSVPAPRGIASTPTTSASMRANKKVGVFRTIIESIKNIFRSIFTAIKDIFLSIFPFRKLLSKKQTPSDKELQYYDLRKKLYRINSISPLLAEKEAEDLLPNFNAFVRLAEIELEEQESQESIVSLVVQREEPSIEDKAKMGRAEAKKDHKKLIAVLKTHYKALIKKLEKELIKEKIPS